MIWVFSGPHQPRAGSTVSFNPFLEPDSSSTCHNTIPLALKSEGNRPPLYIPSLALALSREPHLSSPATWSETEGFRGLGVVLKGGELFIPGVSRPVTTEFCKRLQEKPYVPWGEASLSLGLDIDGTILDLLGRNNTPRTSTVHKPHYSSIHPFDPLSPHPSILPRICSIINWFPQSYSFSFNHHPICVFILYFIHSPIILYTYLSIHLTTHLSYHLSIIFSSIHPSILQPFT